MSDLSYYESRNGKLSASPEKVFAFVTDMKNFERFIPPGAVRNWQTDGESCSFSVPTIGSVNVRLSRKEEYSKVVYKGDALKKNDFELILDIDRDSNNNADVKIKMSADLNPLMKAVASRPLTQFLEMLVSEMEKFNDWEKIR